jgi:hypothetical protein
MESATLESLAPSEIISATGTERNLGKGEFIFVIAVYAPTAQDPQQPKNQWVVSEPAAVTPGGVWTAEVDINPPYRGKLSLYYGITPRCRGTACQPDQLGIAWARERLLRLGTAGFAFIGHAPGEVKPPIGPEQALLTGDQIATIVSSPVVKSLLTVNSLPMLDLSSKRSQYIGACKVKADILVPSAAHSLVRTGIFSVPGTGMTKIGEQVASYKRGYGTKALVAITAAMRGCGFTRIQGLPANVIGFNDSKQKTGEWAVEIQGDALIEVGISKMSKPGQLSPALKKLVSAIALKAGTLGIGY